MELYYRHDELSSPMEIASLRSSNFDDIRENHVGIVDDTMIFLPDWAQAFLTASNILVLIVAFCGNIAAIVVVVRSRLPKLSTRCLLITLAMSDLILAISSMPIDLGKLLDKYHSWIFGTFLCEVIPSVQTHFFMMNAFCLLAISIERYITVMRSVKTSKLSPTWEARLPYIILVFTWILPFGCSIPLLWTYDEWSFWLVTRVNGTFQIASNRTYYLCQQSNDLDGNAIFFASLGVIFFALMIAFLFCYLSIILFVKTHGSNFSRHHPDHGLNTNVSNFGGNSRTMPNTSVTPANNNHGRHRRTVRLIMCLILIFIICRSPNWLFLIIVNVERIPKTQANTCALYFVHLCSSVSTALSPFVYAIWNDSLRTTDSTGERNHCCFSGSSSDSCKERSFQKIFLLGKGNMYDLTTQNKFQSNSTQRFGMSEKNLPSLKSTSKASPPD